MKKHLILSLVVGMAFATVSAVLTTLYGVHCWQAAGNLETPLGLILSEFVVFFFVFATGPCCLAVKIKSIQDDSGSQPFKQAIAEAHYSARFFPGESTALFLLRRKFLFYLVLVVPILSLLTLAAVDFIAAMSDMVRDIRRPRFHFLSY